MKMNPEEITAIIKDQIKNYDVDLNVDDVGSVIEIGDGIAHIHGLDKAMAGELLDFGNDIYGLVLNLEQDNVGAVILGGETKIKEGSQVKRTGRIMQVPVGEAMIGRVVDALGRPIDGKGKIETTETRPVEYPAPGIADRKPVKEPLQTGIKLSTPSYRSAVASVSSSSATAASARRPSRSTRSSTSTTRTASASMSPSARRPRRLRASSRRSKSAAPWTTRSS